MSSVVLVPAYFAKGLSPWDLAGLLQQFVSQSR